MSKEKVPPQLEVPPALEKPLQVPLMNLETFFEKFELFADAPDAPDAVKRMRRFILDLAVQGKLVAQDAEDELAEELLERVQAEKARLVKLGEIKKQEQLPPVGEEAIPFPLPNGWAASQVGEIAACLDYMREPINGTERGLRIAGKRQDELFPYYGATQQQGWIDDFIFDEELVLLGEDGVPFHDALRSKAYLISGKTWVNNHAHVFRGILVSNHFLMHWLNVFDYTGRIAGSTRSKLNQAKALDIPIALPPLAEQRRIVAKVDELMALCDRLDAQQQEREKRHAALARASLARFAEAPTPAHLHFLFHPSYAIPPADLRKSILTLAVQGKLVPQDPNDEPAEVLLAHIARKRTELLNAAYPNRDEASTQLRKQASQVLPAELESLAPGWSWATLIQASLLIVDCHNKTAPYVQSGTRLLRTTNIRDGRLNLTEPKFVDDATYERWSARCKPEPGDVLITREAPMGEVCIIPEGMKVCLGQRMMLIRLVPGTMDQKYLLYSLMAPDLMDRIQDKPVGVTVQHLRVGGVETLLTPLPPLAEQRRIVAKVEQLMALVDALEKQLLESRERGAKLMEALLGELTART